MNKVLVLAAFVIVAVTGCATTGGGTQSSVIRAKNKVAPALVHIRPVKEVFRRGRREERLIVGSGFIISADGYVVTNEHVAGKSRSVRCVLSDKEEVDAEVVGVDPYTDIAVLKLVTDRTDLPYVSFGKSADLEAGQTVMALGSPHGLARSVSSGIVSVTDRYLASGGSMVAPYNNWIQTDAAINPGNSGGPLVNIKGEVIGINTRRLTSADNVGFAIPIDIAVEVIAQIIDHGEVRRSTIGAQFQEITRKTDDPTMKGVVIADIDPLSPSYRAQLRPGDILTSINGVQAHARYVEDLPAIRKRIADIPVGDEVTLGILRGDENSEVKLQTVAKSEIQGDQREFEEWGCSISELTPAVIRRAQLTSMKGVVVTGTQQGGLAATARLVPGEIVLKIDDEEVVNLKDFSEKYEARVESNQPLVLLTVKSGALTRFVLIKQSSDEENGVPSDD